MTELYAEVVRHFEGEGPIAAEDVRRWIDSGDLLVWSAVYELIGIAYERIDPSFDSEQAIEFTRRYLLRCIEENPSPGELLHGGYEAAWELATLLKEWRTRGGKPADAIRGVAIDLEKVYRRGDTAAKTRVLCGVLEHAFEDAALRRHFSNWERGDAELREAFKLAMEWGLSHEG
ncbi:MAG TPA: hypothetical protein VGF48_21050 [Thermoanaerobaculia bacterium]|jgi:hypothetical protein